MEPKRWTRQVWDGFCLRGLPTHSVVYGLFAGACVLWVGMQFFATLKWQLSFAQARLGTWQGGQPWSAPLDDVFIHFDFARSAARGYPLQWSEGNGYSSGGTSLLYPFVLALGYGIGYEDLDLMLWAGVVACLGVWTFLICARSLFRGLPRPAELLIPPILLGVGALNWSLWSGMEVAFFLAVWGACLWSWTELLRAPTTPTAARLGLCCALLVATRPESAAVVAVFTLTALGYSWSRLRLMGRLTTLAWGAVPGALVVLGLLIANKVFTGDWSAAGAQVKLEANHPYMPLAEVIEAWKFHVSYQVLRVTDYHFSSFQFPLFGLPVSAGWLVWVLALLPLAFRPTRRPAILLWLCMVAWVTVVAFNGQVRWQNERYTMPAVAWLLLAAALGLGAVLARAVTSLDRHAPEALSVARFRKWQIRGLAVVCLTFVVTFAVFQRERFRDQLWFFGRASRNIFEQHVQAGVRLRHSAASRVLVGDAGALSYVSDLPALDIIGLGGFHDFPFARATRMGVGAGIELIARMRPADRPDLMAIYPSWWGDLPTWFGEKVDAFPVRGNVICGGRSKVFYRPDWQPLDSGAAPFAPVSPAQLVAEVDVADLVSEREAQFRVADAPGFVTMKLLPHPTRPAEDAWDAGRVLPAGSRSKFTMSGLAPNQPLTLLLRTAPEARLLLQVETAGRSFPLELSPEDGWREVPLTLPAEVIKEAVELEVRVLEGELVLHHVWGVQGR